MPSVVYLQMHRHTSFAQVIHAQYTRNEVPSQVIKDQHLPDRVTIAIQNRAGLSCEPLESSFLGRAVNGIVIEIEDLFYGRLVVLLVTQDRSR